MAPVELNGSHFPTSACCLGCGYLLRGLEQPVCPECGRKFDPADPKSFAATPKLRLWRRWRWRLVGMFALALLLLVAAPRGRQFGTLMFTCQNCRESHTFNRWQFLPPKWMPRYPGVTWREKAQTSAITSTSNSCQHDYVISFTCIGGYIATRVATTMSSTRTWAITINGHAITLETAHDDLKTLMDPMIAGVGP